MCIVLNMLQQVTPGYFWMNPYPYPAKTHTRWAGTGFCRGPHRWTLGLPRPIPVGMYPWVFLLCKTMDLFWISDPVWKNIIWDYLWHFWSYILVSKRPDIQLCDIWCDTSKSISVSTTYQLLWVSLLTTRQANMKAPYNSFAVIWMMHV